MLVAGERVGFLHVLALALEVGWAVKRSVVDHLGVQGKSTLGDERRGDDDGRQDGELQALSVNAKQNEKVRT